MGEGDEQLPLAVITNAGFVHFQKRNPTKKELENLKIELEDDVYASFLTSVKWRKGKNGNHFPTDAGGRRCTRGGDLFCGTARYGFLYAAVHDTISPGENPFSLFASQ